uniref:Uncharacterized protein n=1 Tax=Allium cepa TaxID=4679 RepID=Q2XNX6_ALLCE|nr:hypothetical protein 11.t00005 [Allium cepa]
MGRSYGFNCLRGSSIFHHSGWDSALANAEIEMTTTIGTIAPGTHHLEGKLTIMEKLAELKARFLIICFDGLKFLLAIHHIPGHVKQSVIARNNDVYIQPDAFVDLAEKDEDLSSYKYQPKTVQKSAKDTAEAVNRLEDAQKKEIDEVVQRCSTLALEKDYVQKDRVAFAQRAKLDEELSKAEMLKDEAREKGKRIAFMEIDSHLETAAEARREGIKCMFGPLIAEYDARVESSAEEVDKEALLKEFLRGNEPSDLSIAKALYSKDSSPLKGKNDIASPSGAESSVPPPTLPTDGQSLDPSEQHIGYDPKDPGLVIHVLSPIPKDETVGRLRVAKKRRSDPKPTPRSDDATYKEEKICEEQLAEEKKKNIVIKVEPQVVELDDPLNRPLKVIHPGGSKSLKVPLPSSDVTSLASKASKQNRIGEESAEKPRKEKKKNNPHSGDSDYSSPHSGTWIFEVVYTLIRTLGTQSTLVRTLGHGDFKSFILYF